MGKDEKNRDYQFWKYKAEAINCMKYKKLIIYLVKCGIIDILKAILGSNFF